MLHLQSSAPWGPRPSCLKKKKLQICSDSTRDDVPWFLKSALQVASALNPIRFLGMEIHATTRGFTISQRPYIRELLRLHEISSQRLDVVPVIGKLEASKQPRGGRAFSVTRSGICCLPTVFVNNKSAAEGGRDHHEGTGIPTAHNGVCPFPGSRLVWIGVLCRQLVCAAWIGSRTGWVTMLFGVPISWRSSRQSTT